MRYASTVRVPVSRCPHCGAAVEFASHPLVEGVSPRPGSLVICASCRGWGVFLKGGGLRKATDAELARARIDDPFEVALAESAAEAHGREIAATEALLRAVQGLRRRRPWRRP